MPIEGALTQSSSLLQVSAPSRQSQSQPNIAFTAKCAQPDELSLSQAGESKVLSLPADSRVETTTGSCTVEKHVRIVEVSPKAAFAASQVLFSYKNMNIKSLY
jgi:hypothetical protein